MFSLTELHPMSVHFPIALVIVGFLAEFLSIFIKKETCLPKISFYLLILGTLSAIVAVLAGGLFTSEMSGEAGIIRETHALLALTTLTLLVITSMLRIIPLLTKKTSIIIDRLAFVFYLFAVIAVSVTGFFGGTLVYTYMMPL